MARWVAPLGTAWVGSGATRRQPLPKASAAPTAGTPAMAAIGQKPNACSSRTARGIIITLGIPAASPYSPVVSPWRPGGATSLAINAPATVKTANPTPRSTQMRYSPAPELAQISSGAGSPSTRRPMAIVAGVDRRRSSAGTTG